MLFVLPQVSRFRPQFSDGKKNTSSWSISPKPHWSCAHKIHPTGIAVFNLLIQKQHHLVGVTKMSLETTPRDRGNPSFPPPKCCPQVISWFINFEPVKLWIHALYCIFYTQQKPTLPVIKYQSSNKNMAWILIFWWTPQCLAVFGGTMWYSQCLAPGCCRRHSRHRPRSRRNRHSVGQQRRRRSRRWSERPAAELWHCCLKRLGNTSNQQL